MFISKITYRVNVAFLIVLLPIVGVTAFGQGNTFSYQGRLTDTGNPATGTYEMQFKLFDLANGGAQQGPAITNSTVQVTNGVFTVQLDFGACPSCFDGSVRFLEISVRPAGSPDAFTVLSPRQAITSTPYAVRSATAASAANASQLGGLNASGFIQNTTSQQAATSFNIGGSGTVGGTLTGGVLNATTQYNIGGLRMLTASGPFNSGGTIVLAVSNTFLGENAGLNTTPNPSLDDASGKFNSFFGADAGKANTNGRRNSFFGERAGECNTNGIHNSFFGGRAGGSNATGINNSFFGTGAGESNTTGLNNSFFGVAAGDSNITGFNNTNIGVGARLGASNLTNATAIGFLARVDQSNSIVLGSINGVNGSGSTVNVGIGLTAPKTRLDVVSNESQIRFGDTVNDEGGYLLSTVASQAVLAGGTRWNGSDFIAKSSSSSAINMFNGIIRFFNDTGLTAGSTFSPTEVMRITASGSVGIGTTAPTARLSVSGAGPFDNSQSARFDLFNTVANTGYLQHVTDAGLWQIGTTAGATRMVIASDGDVGIGTISPADKLQVAGDIRIGTGTTGCVRDADATVIAGACSSDARLKRAITPFPNLLDKLVRLRPVHFYWRADGYKDRAFGEAQSFGLIAQEVEQVLPELVSEDEQGLKVVRYNKLPLLMLQAIKELKTENDSLKQRLYEMNRERDQIKQQQIQIENLRKIICLAHPNTEGCK